MAVLGRLRIGSQQRVDLTDLLSIDSYVSNDFRHLVKSFVGSSPMILKGFEVIDAPLAVGSSSISIKIADSVLYNPLSSAGSFYYGLPEGDTFSQPLSPTLKPNAVNYIYVTLTTTGAAQDTRAFWDVDLNGGQGGEFNQDVNTESLLTVQANASVSSFPDGSVPVCKVDVGIDGNITSITDCRNLMFRLGSGGTSPDPTSTFNFRSLPTAGYERSEPSVTAISPTSPTPFFGGDKNIFTMKEWMDVVMTKLLELGGTTYWYEAPPSLSILNIFDDALGSAIKSKGQWVHDGNTPGLIKWTDDLIYSKTNDPRDIIIRGDLTGKQLADGEVMWAEMLRNLPHSTGLSYTNSSSIVTGGLGDFTGLIKGDWIRGKEDGDNLYLRVEEFYSDLAATTPSSAASALSLRLSGNYQGLTGSGKETVYTRGVIDNTDIKISDRKDADMLSAGGSFYWLATRNDTVMGIAGNVANNFSSNVSITAADGIKATLQFASPHGLSDGDRIWVSNLLGAPAVKIVEVLSPSKVSVETAETTLLTGLTVKWTEITTAARDNGHGLQLESANHGFSSNQVVEITEGAYGSDTSNGIGAGHFVLTVSAPNKFRIAAASVPLLSPNATARKANVILKTDFGAINVIQGETVDVNQPETQNILKFIGMNSLAETSPVYKLPDTYNTIYATQNYNSSADDNLTERVSQVTSMMASRIQDRGIRVAGQLSFTNEYQNALNQKLTLSGAVELHKPSGSSQTISLGGPFSLLENECVYLPIDRNGGSSSNVNKTAFNANTILDENRLVLAWRTTGTEIYTIDGQRLVSGSRYTYGENETAQSKNISVKDTAGVNYNATSKEWYYNTTLSNVIINIPGGTSNEIDTAAVMTIASSSRLVLDGQAVWIRVNRGVAKTFNTVITTNASYQDDNTNGALYIDNIADVPTDQDVFVIYQVQDLTMSKMHHVSEAVGNIYEEDRVLISNVAAPSLITLPLDSRNHNEAQVYVVGSGQLQVFLNGQKLRLTDDYLESGSIGSLSNQIQVQQDLIGGDILTFRIDGTGGVYFTPAPAAFTDLQVAYNNGNVISVQSGSPVTINGPIGEKLLVINGDLDVTGVIDPKGITFSRESINPLEATQDGLWIDTNGHLIHSRNGEADLDITQPLTDPTGLIAAGTALSYAGTTLNVNLGSSVSLDNNNALIVYPDPNGAIVDSGSGVSVNLESSNPSLYVSGNQLGVKIDLTSPIVSDVDGLKLNTEANSLEVVGSQLNVKTDPVGAIVKNGDGLAISVDDDTIGIFGNTLQVKNASKLFIDLTNASGSLVPAGSLVAANPSSNHFVLASATSLQSAQKFIGVTRDAVANGAVGKVQIAGIATMNGGSFVVGQAAYLSTSAGLASSSAPSLQGSATFCVGVATSSTEVLIQAYFLGVNGGVYDETYVASGSETAGTVITLPLDSRNGNAARTYAVGSGQLEVYLNGQKLQVNDDYTESSSSAITIQQDLLATDEINFRIGVIGTAISGGGGMSDPTTTAGDLIYRNNSNSLTRLPAGAVGQVLSTTGAGTVAWVNSPAGFSDPMTTAGDLIYKDGAGTTARLPIGTVGYSLTAINSTTVGWSLPYAPSNISRMANTSGGVIPALYPVRIDTNGDANLIDVSIEAHASAVVGVALASISNGSIGNVVTDGVVPNIGNSFAYGSLLYVSKNGDLTSTVPDIGVGTPPFVAGDWIIKLGVVKRNPDIAGQRDLVLNIEVIAQL